MRWVGRKWGLAVLITGLASDATADTPRRGIVAAGQAVATQAGLDAFAAGGNAVDAAIACALTLGVVDGHNSGIGGGCFMTLRLADGRVLALDGRETAPAGARAELFLRDGKPDPRLSRDGALAVGVPGELALLAYAGTNFGRLPLARHLEAASRVASKGFALDRHFASRLAATREGLGEFEPSRDIFLRADGSPWRAGDRLVQRDLATSYQQIAAHGADWFYRGPFADRLDAWMRGHGGILNADDLRRYRVRTREPVRGTYRGWEIVSFPPPSSGGVHVIQILNILEHFDLRSMGDRSAAFAHTVAEAMKRAFADRAHWLGDPEFTPVPRGLVSKDYARGLALGIRPDRATPVPGAGSPPHADSDHFSVEAARHTTHFSTADTEGNWVACTASLNTSFGSKVVIPGTGILLNNHMDDFAMAPGVPNAFGLVGNDANAVAPGKRPLSSMSPTLLLREGRPVLSVGAAGGPTIISQTVLAIVRTVDFGQDPATALAGPRLHHQWLPDELHLEAAFEVHVLEALKSRGHTVVVEPVLGAAQVVGIEGGVLLGAADPRGEGRAAAW